MQAKIAVLKNERTMVWVFIWLIIGLALLYVYFMNEAVFTVAKRANLEQELSMRASNISGLEFKSITMRNNIDIDLAYSLGFRDLNTENLRYVSKTPVTALVSLNTVQ